MKRVSQTMIKEIMNTNLNNRIYYKFIVQDAVKDREFFLRMLKKYSVIVSKRMGKDIEFAIDDYNSEVINQLWLYITNDPMFNGDLQKGLFISGNIGTGKTLLMLTFLEVMKKATGRGYESVFPESIHQVFKARGLAYFKQRPMLFDDVTREPERVEGYWGENPIRQLIMHRYRFPSQNYATANVQIFSNGKIKHDNAIIKRYGAMVFDRMREMFNFLELTGKSRRG